MPRKREPETVEEVLHDIREKNYGADISAARYRPVIKSIRRFRTAAPKPVAKKAKAKSVAPPKDIDIDNLVIED